MVGSPSTGKPQSLKTEFAFSIHRVPRRWIVFLRPLLQCLLQFLIQIKPNQINFHSLTGLEKPVCKGLNLGLSVHVERDLVIKVTVCVRLRRRRDSSSVAQVQSKVRAAFAAHERAGRTRKTHLFSCCQHIA